MLYTVKNEKELQKLKNLSDKFSVDFQNKISKIECVSGFSGFINIVVNSAYLHESFVACLPKLENMKITEIDLHERTIERQIKKNTLAIWASLNETIENDDIFNAQYFCFTYYLEDNCKFKTEFI